jgi:hypothetical protein
MALSRRLLIRMRSQVQVLAGPPPIPAGHSAVDTQPGTPAASLGRAGAAPPPRQQAHRPFRVRPPRRPAPRSPLSVVAHPTQHGSRAAGAASSRHRKPLALRTPACLVAQPVTRGRRLPLPGPVRIRHQPPLTDARPGSVARVQALGRRPSRPTARQPTGTRPVPVTGARRSDLSQRHRRCRTDGRVRTDGVDTSRLDTGRLDTRRLDTRPSDTRPSDTRPSDTERPDTERPDRWTPDDDSGDRTPDGLDTGRLDRRIPDDEPGWVDAACWTRTGGRRHGGRPDSVDHGDDARPLDAGWTLRRAAAVRASNNQDRSAARTRGHHARTGLATAATGQLQVVCRRPAGASAHCSPRTISGRA